MAKAKKEPLRLLQALEFMALVQKDKGAPYQTHVMLANNCAVGFDGVLAAGHLIDESLFACPHTLTMLAALKRCEGALSVTQLDSGRLSVKSGKFRALVPCTPNATLPGVMPDPVAGPITNALRDGLLAVSPIIVENSQRVITAAAAVRANSVVATNGNMILEYWHGIDLPPNMLVPKLFINALARIDKNLVSFGFSATSFTVYFDDHSWLRTQLYQDRYPDTDRILNRPHTALPLPDDFFKGIAVVSEFAEDNRLWLKPGAVQSHADESVGARYEVEGVQADIIVNGKDLRLLDGVITSIDITGTEGVTFFYGENLRGAMTQMRS